MSGVFVYLVLMTGCANLAAVAPPVTTSMVAVSGGASAETLTAGRSVFTRQCTACHSADPVARYSFAEWRGIVADMTERTRLSAEQEAALLAYLRAAPRAVAPGPE